jgi:hypothetical protein
MKHYQLQRSQTKQGTLSRGRAIFCQDEVKEVGAVNVWTLPA